MSTWITFATPLRMAEKSQCVRFCVSRVHDLCCVLRTYLPKLDDTTTRNANVLYLYMSTCYHTFECCSNVTNNKRMVRSQVSGVSTRDNCPFSYIIIKVCNYIFEDYMNPHETQCLAEPQRGQHERSITISFAHTSLRKHRARKSRISLRVRIYIQDVCWQLSGESLRARALPGVYVFAFGWGGYREVERPRRCSHASDGSYYICTVKSPEALAREAHV